MNLNKSNFQEEISIKKKALITGITGQDGAYLAKLLIDKGYSVFGTYRRVSTPNFWRLQCLNIIDKITLIPADIADMASLLEAVKLSEPDEIYNLAAQSYVGASFDQPLFTAEIDAVGSLKLLEIMDDSYENYAKKAFPFEHAFLCIAILQILIHLNLSVKADYHPHKYLDIMPLTAIDAEVTSITSQIYLAST